MSERCVTPINHSTFKICQINMCGKMDTFNGLEKLVSNIKEPIWFSREKVDFNAKCLIREFLQKCSSDKIVEMLKNILSVEERMGLVKTEMESFFQNQTKSFENHMKVKNYLNSDDQVQTRIKTEPKDVDFNEKPKELKITFYKCVLCSNKYETSQDIESHLTNVHSVSIHCQNLFIEKETSTTKLTENIDENVVSINANSVLESQTKINEQAIEENESNKGNIQNGDQHSDYIGSIIPRLSDSMEEITDLSNNTSENPGVNEVIQDLLKKQVLLPCLDTSSDVLLFPSPTLLSDLQLFEENIDENVSINTTSVLESQIELSNNTSERRSENPGVNKVIQDLLKKQVLLPCLDTSGVAPSSPPPTLLSDLQLFEENIDENVATNTTSVLKSQIKLSKSNKKKLNEKDIGLSRENIQNTLENINRARDSDSSSPNNTQSLKKETEIPMIRDSSEPQNLSNIENINFKAINEKPTVSENSNIGPVKDAENYREILLPYSWKKVCSKRKNCDRWDCHVLSPQGKKLRSNIEIKKYLEVNPDIKCDRNLTNTSKNFGWYTRNGRIKEIVPYLDTCMK
jgi:hypothetical protein